MPYNEEEAIPEGGDGSGGDFIQTVKVLNDQEAVRLRFLTDWDKIYWNKFHRVMESGSFKGFIICDAATGDICENCEKDKNWPQTLWFAWVYELEHTDKDGEWEEVNEVKLMRYAVAHKASVRRANTNLGTLLENEFVWVREGKMGSKKPSYFLEAGKESKLSAELKKIVKDLPSLEDVAFERVTKLGDDEEPSKEQKTRKRPKAKAAKEDDDDNFGSDDDNGDSDDPF